MSQLAIKAENISKQYRLGKVGTGTLSHDLNRLWYKVRGLEDPYVKIGETNDRSMKGESDYVWSLRDINFEIEQGDSVGIIGRNGAGKSTLLKLLSKVTKPTTGGFKVKGRIASLLEVGTGFNPEMTGRENIYLNGAILGMRRAEITKKLDEIINFSGVERYIDTPVKRYSSGMYVRLAFAVAAHLESEILIVDEVLAVGDAEFQKKCLGKMNDVSKGEGRTVLFVSHNMAAVQNLCFKGLLLENGIIKKTGAINDVLAEYLVSTKIENVKLSENTNRKGNGFLKFTDGFFVSDNDNNIETFKDLKIKLNFELNFASKIIQSRIDIGINNFMGDRVAWLSSNVVISEFSVFSNSIEFLIKDLPLAPGDYTLNIYSEINNEIADWLTEVMPFTIIEKDYYKTGKLTLKNQGNILLNFYAK
jgi:lipopolysaccharide transport system ATP-binding protein